MAEGQILRIRSHARVALPTLGESGEHAACPPWEVDRVVVEETLNSCSIVFTSLAKAADMPQVEQELTECTPMGLRHLSFSARGQTERGSIVPGDQEEGDVVAILLVL